MKNSKCKLGIKWLLTGAFLFAGMLIHNAPCQTRVRNEIRIPDIPGYKTLKCDFHIHTIHSDGNVRPHIRPEEAWREGLDAISISEHVEDLDKGQHNQSYELALSRAKSLGIILIRGGEITRSMPPGHFNAIFLKDITPLDTDNYKDAIEAAIKQDAFVFWNHPGWTGQQPDGISRWYDHQTELYEKGWLHGIEVVNETNYYPRVHQWCLDKKLTLMGNSDIHNPIQMNYNFHQGDHRAVTLVFARGKSEKSIKKALFARRTAVYNKNNLIGEEAFLSPIFDASVEMINSDITIHGDGSAYVQIHNHSDIPFELISTEKLEEISFPGRIILHANKTVLFRVSGKSETLSGTKKFKLPYVVKNCWIAPEQGLPVTLTIRTTFYPEE